MTSPQPPPPLPPWLSLQSHVPPDGVADAEEVPCEEGGGGGEQQQPQQRRAVIWAPSLPDLRDMIARAAEPDGEGGAAEEEDDEDAGDARAAQRRREVARAALGELSGATHVQAAGVFPPGTGMAAIAMHGARALAATARALAEAAAAAGPGGGADAATATTHHHHHDPFRRRRRPPLPASVALGSDDTFLFTPDDLVQASALLRPGSSLARVFGGFWTDAGLPLSGLRRLTVGLLLAPGAAPHDRSPRPPRGVFPASVQRLCMVPYAQLQAPYFSGARGDDDDEEEEGEGEAEPGGGGGGGTTAPLSLAACRDMRAYLCAVRCCRDLRALEVAAEMDTALGGGGGGGGDAESPPAPREPERLVSPPCAPPFFASVASAFSRLRELRVVARFEAASGGPFIDLSPFALLETADVQNLSTRAAPAPRAVVAPPPPPARRAAAALPSSPQPPPPSSDRAGWGPPPLPQAVFLPPPPAAFDLELGLPRSGRLRALRLSGFVVVGRAAGGGGSGGGGGGGAEARGPLPAELRLERCALRARRGGSARGEGSGGGQPSVQAPEVALVNAAAVVGAREADDATEQEEEGAAGGAPADAATRLSLCRSCCCFYEEGRRPGDEKAWGRWILRTFLAEEEEEGQEEEDEEAAAAAAGDVERGGGDSECDNDARPPLPVAARVCSPGQNEPALVLAAWDAAAGRVEAAAAAGEERREEEEDDDEGAGGGAAAAAAAAGAAAAAAAGAVAALRIAGEAC